MSLEEAEAHQLVERGTSVSPLHSLWAGATAFIAGQSILLICRMLIAKNDSKRDCSLFLSAFLKSSILLQQLDSAGGAIAGASHFAGTAKALEEEGISKAQRLRALPTAVSFQDTPPLGTGPCLFAMTTQPSAYPSSQCTSPD